MPGREDFGKIQSRLLSDERAHRAAEGYSESLCIPEDLALATVVGHVAMLGIYVSRETDDGVLDGNGVAAFRSATMSPLAVSREAVRILTEAGLLRQTETGVYVCGFHDCYGKMVSKRHEAKKRMADARSKNVRGTCGERASPEERRGEKSREEENPPSAREGGSASPQEQDNKPKLLTPAERSAMLSMCEALVSPKKSQETRRLAAQARAWLRGPPSDDDTALIEFRTKALGDTDARCAYTAAMRVGGGGK